MLYDIYKIKMGEVLVLEIGKDDISIFFILKKLYPVITGTTCTTVTLHYCCVNLYLQV